MRLRANLKKTWAIFACAWIFSQSVLLFGYEPKLLSEAELVANPFTDHVQHFAKLFRSTRIHSFFEFGLGEGTKFFLDHCDEVVSFDIVPDNNRKVKEINTDWHRQCLDLYQKYPNWSSGLYYASHDFSLADEISNSMCDPALSHPFYLIELKILCDTFLDKRYDAIFVDPGTVLRADLVNELFDRADIIAAHDYREPVHGQYGGVYGWSKINAPSHYIKIFFSEGCGTVFWIHQDRKDLIKALTSPSN